MCEYFAIRADEGRALPLSEVGERLAGLGLRHDRTATWLTADLMLNAEVDGSGRFATDPDDLVVSLDVTLWCPHSHRTAEWPDEATTTHLLDTVARTLGWTLLGQDDPAY